jgi:pimeloyl-ACP methyl ester carboxylesterase
MKDKKRSPKEWEFIVEPGPGTKLPSGGMYPPYGHIGHWEVTGKVVEEMGFTSSATNILCDAAQDPDFYDFATVVAHAQTPDEADFCKSDKTKRQAIIEKAIDDYLGWLKTILQKSAASLEKHDTRLSLYWLGYALHGIEDLSVHKGITNGEHAAATNNPDYEAADVALSYVYARRVLDCVRNALGQDAFDRLRNHDGEGKLSFFEKHRKGVHPGGWDLDNHFSEYQAAGKKYKTIRPTPEPVRWDREYVLSRVLEQILERRVERMKRIAHEEPAVSANPHRRFDSLVPLVPLARPARWTVLIYMAGDDCNPEGIEYAISQDLAEIKKVGSSDSVHFLVQTDDASGTASYRYRLRKKTSIESDRLERFDGDLNTGSTKTLVDFVKWGTSLFPAERTALVLWGHGSGHDDQNVYRAVRGSVNPRTAARLARKRLGFFSATRRSMLEQGPTRGYGYDDTAGDFLDNSELRKALRQIKVVLGRKLDLLGFDACLMAMIEVAYQIHDVVEILVASERTEPGDGWWYDHAFSRLRKDPAITARDLAKDIVEAYREAYADDMTLSAVDLERIPALANHITAWTEVAEESDFHYLRRSALDCSPRPGDGYCDLASFLDAASESERKGSDKAKIAQKALEETIIASCGRAKGLTIYAPGNFRPQRAGNTDALYLGLSFPRETGWGAFLRRVYPPLKYVAADVESLPIPTPSTGLDRYNARHILAAVQSRSVEGWVDRLRGEVLGPCTDMVNDVLNQLNTADPPRNTIKSPPVRRSDSEPGKRRRILILPGIMGSLLHDRSGKLGAVWVDPWNLIFGNDFDELKLEWEADTTTRGKAKTPSMPIPLPLRIPDADKAVLVQAYGVVPVIYDRMALALMHEFGPVVEFAPFDWRQPLSYLGQGLATRIEALTKENRAIEIALVAHSMGGLVATDACAKLQAENPAILDSVKSLVVLGTPFLGSVSALRAMRAETGNLNLLKLLGHKSPAEIENTIQTFRGLFEMLPGDQEELLKCAVFAPGPLSRLAPDDPRLKAPLGVVRDLPSAILERTRAIICTTKDTAGPVQIADDDSLDYSNVVAGDGTVTVKSALNDGKLLSKSVEVDQAHMTLTLDSEAIERTVEWVGMQLGVSPLKSVSGRLPPSPEIDLPDSREGLMRRLEADDELTLGDFVALISGF